MAQTFSLYSGSNSQTSTATTTAKTKTNPYGADGVWLAKIGQWYDDKEHLSKSSKWTELELEVKDGKPYNAKTGVALPDTDHFGNKFYRTYTTTTYDYNAGIGSLWSKIKKGWKGFTKGAETAWNWTTGDKQEHNDTHFVMRRIWWNPSDKILLYYEGTVDDAWQDVQDNLIDDLDELNYQGKEEGIDYFWTGQDYARNMELFGEEEEEENIYNPTAAAQARTSAKNAVRTALLHPAKSTTTPTTKAASDADDDDEDSGTEDTAPTTTTTTTTTETDDDFVPVTTTPVTTTSTEQGNSNAGLIIAALAAAAMLLM